MHGQCVALGSLAASYLSMRRGQITEAELTAIKEAEYLLLVFPVSVEGDDTGRGCGNNTF